MAMRVQTEGINHTNSRKEKRYNKMTGLLMNFCRCGIAGWCLEVMFTSVDSIMAGDWTLMGQTSLLMFPIYGMGALLLPISRFTGTWLTGLGICPWDYSAWPDNVGGVIRLKFAPLWFGTGLLFEYLTSADGGSGFSDTP